MTTETLERRSGDSAPAKAPSALLRERVTDVWHWTDNLFTFRTTRDASFRFDSGQFAMIGLEVDGKPLLRAYSMACAVYDDYLEFFSIKVPNGPLTSRLQHIKAGDTLLVGRKPTGTLVLGNLKPGKRLYMLSTGTGLAPFASLIKDPAVYDAYDKIILVQGTRTVAELEYGTRIVMAARNNEFLGEVAQEKLMFYTTVTREPYYHQGRVTDEIADGRLFRELGLPPLSTADDRVMICGNSAMLAELKGMLETQGFQEGSASTPGDFVIERAFVER